MKENKQVRKIISITLTYNNLNQQKIQHKKSRPQKEAAFNL
jgi:hypothetical protein